MSVGKYSPTISSSYARDQDWWTCNGGGYQNGLNPNADEDNDGFDSYGYSQGGSGPDRAGYCEDQYLTGEWYEEEYCHPLYEEVSREWSGRLLGDLNDYVGLHEVAQAAQLRDYRDLASYFPMESRFIGKAQYIHRDDANDTLARYAAAKAKRP